MQEVNPVPLLAFAGWAGSGKDTAADLIGWPKRAWADPVYAAAIAIDPFILDEQLPFPARLSDVVNAYGWDNCKRTFPEVRRLLQVVGTEAGRGIHGHDCWVRLANLTGPACFVGTRFHNEIQAIRSAGGAVVWVERPGIGTANGHASEHQLGPRACDYILRNDGDLADLEENIRVMLAHLGFIPLLDPV